MTETAAIAAQRPRAQRLTAAGWAEQELRSMIIAGELAPDERLNEVALADTFGISRGPLREAIQRLASEGLLRVVTHKGAYVASLSEAQLVDLYELRIAIETHAVRIGTERSSDAEKQGLLELLATTQAVLEHDEEPHYPADLDFHNQIVALAGSECLTQAAHDAHARINLARARSAYGPERARNALREHQKIVDYVLAGDGAAAAAALDAHLRSSLENAVAVMIR